MSALTMGKKRNRSGSFSKSSSGDCGKKSDDWDSQEETDYVEGGQVKYSNGVRCSARVMEKQEKLRRESSPAKQTISNLSDCLYPNQAAPIVTSSASTNISSLLNRSVGGDEDYADLSSATTVLPVTVSSPSYESLYCCLPSTSSGCSGLEEKRKKRNWEVWSQDDKQHFFEALNEFGKDFDAIQNHLAAKLKSRKIGSLANFVPKNKDQVRHFYYRTWHKIAKHLKFPKDMKRVNQELYGLVNYGELRKKQRVLNMKNAAKLSELMEKGTTTIKVRGKTFRIKTPLCRAIKRMNLLDDEYSRVPCKIYLELIAQDGKSWAIVQGISHNPRVKVQVPLQRTLSSVITYFEERWKTSTDRLKEQLIQTFGKKQTPRLRFIPVEKGETQIPIFKVSESTNSAKISLKSYTEKVLLGTSKGSKHRQDDFRKQSGNVSDGVLEAEVSGIDLDLDNLKNQNKLQNNTTDEDDKSEDNWSDTVIEANLYQNPVYKTATPVLSEQPEEKHSAESTVDSVPANFCLCPSFTNKFQGTEKDAEEILSHIWADETMKRGWAASEAGQMTIGELYLMLGQCERLCFKYSWDCEEEEERPTKLVDKLIEIARTLRKRKTIRTKLNNSNSIASTCLKCGYQNYQLIGSLGISPTQPVTTNVQYPLSSPLDEPPTRTYSYRPIVPKVLTTSDKCSSSQVTVHSQDRISDNALRYGGQFKSASQLIPPKPFLDLPKGNRRIGRIASKRTVISRIIPLRPKCDVVPNTSFGTLTNAAIMQPGVFVSNASTSALNTQLPSASFMLPNSKLNVKSLISEATRGAGSSKTLQESCQLSVGTSEFEKLLKLKPGDKNVDPENTFSLSSFMDISLPESTCLAAEKVCLNTEESTESSDCDLSISNILDACSEKKPSGLETPNKLRTNDLQTEGGPGNQLPNETSSSWVSSNTNELSFTNLLGTFDTSRNCSQLSENDITFQSVVGEVNFLTKFNDQLPTRVNPKET